MCFFRKRIFVNKYKKCVILCQQVTQLSMAVEEGCVKQWIS